jgi:hypothetical protein
LVPLHPLPKMIPTICFCPAALRDEHRGGNRCKSRGGHETKCACTICRFSGLVDAHE